METALAHYKDLIVKMVDGRKDEFLSMLTQGIQCCTDNPPGDTRGLAAYLQQLIQRKGIEVTVYDPMPENPNIVASLGGIDSRPHLVLNGHLDQFPADDPSLWSVPPYSGKVKDGKIYGRGVSDMKGGLFASLISFLIIHELRVPLRGRLTFTGVSDEETGGRWGTGWLLENRPELIGDACLNGEPYAPDVVGIGERGIYRFVLRVEGESMHGALCAGDNAIIKMGEALLALRPLLSDSARVPDELRRIIETEKGYTRSPQDVGRQWMLDHPSYNVGVIRGGTKVNVVPRYCEAEVDIRVPPGMSVDEVAGRVQNLLETARCSDARVVKILERFEPSYTAVDSPLVEIVRENAMRFTGKEPIYFIGMGATDGRYFRQRGIPTVIYGPRPFNMGGIDEHIEAADFFNVIHVQACSILDFLGLRSE